jgi:riboflavin kinase / FMN adenylyltransferase
MTDQVKSMEIIQGIDNFGEHGRAKPVLALGNFDGVHKGHRAILRATVDRARETGAKSAVLILMPHPLALLSPDNAPALLQTAEDRILMLGEAGIDYVIIHPFTREFAGILPESFAAEILYGRLGVSGVVVGFDYSFGRRGQGNANDLVRLGSRLGFSVEVVEPVSVAGVAVGSTAIRRFLAEGRVEAAAAMLGYPFYLRGKVIHGDGRGRTLGFPTANLAVPPDVIRPANGVYLSKAAYEKETAWALTNVGSRPTFCNADPSIEVYLLDKEKNLYGKELIVSFLQKMREEKTFKSAAELMRQIQRDVELARAIVERS